MKHKTSPVYIAVFLYRFAFLLLAVPLQSVLFEGISPESAVYMYRLDIFFLVILCVWAVVCFYSIRYLPAQNTLTTQRGVLLAQRSQVFLRRFDCVHITENPIFRLFKVCRVQVIAARNNTTLYLSKTYAFPLRGLFCSDKGHKSERLRSNLFSVLLFSIGFSGALTGLLSVAPLLRNIAGIVGESQAQNLLASADLWYYIGYTALPPFLRTLSTIFLLFWAVGAGFELVQYFGLKVSVYKKRIITSHGLLTKHQTIIRKNAISAIVLRQSILLALIGTSTAEAYVPSSNRQGKIPLLLASRSHQCKVLLSSLDFMQKGANSKYIKPSVSTLWGYVWKPLVFLMIVSALCIGLELVSPYKIEVHLAGFVLIWGIVWFIFCTASHRRAYLSISDSGLIISTAQGLSFIETHISRDKIRAIKTTQNIFQKRKGVCNLYVYIRSKSRQSFLIKHIDKSKTAQLTV